MHVVLVYLQPFRRNSLLKCMSQPKIVKNSLKLPILRVQGHSRSSMMTFLRSSSPVLVIMSSISVPICNHFHVGGGNSGRITPFKGGAPVLPSSSWGPPLPRGMKFCHEILKTLSYHMVETEVSILPGLKTVPGRVGQTDKQTDRITVTNTCYS